MSRPVLLFDVGKVLIDFDFSIAARRLAERCDHPAETVLTLFDDIKGPYEVGDMDDAEFVREGMERTGFQGTATEVRGGLVRDLHAERGDAGHAQCFDDKAADVSALKHERSAQRVLPAHL
jgi:hypothetical protein